MCKHASSSTNSYAKLRLLGALQGWAWSVVLMSSFYSHDRLGQDGLKDPPVINRKGHPLTQCFTGALEDRPRGGGGKWPISHVSVANDGEPAAKRQGIRCGICREVVVQLVPFYIVSTIKVDNALKNKKATSFYTTT
jgi:hypothetical protein